MLKEEHGVVITNRSLHQALGVGGRAHRDNLDAGHGVEVGLKSLAVLCPQLTANAARAPHDGGDREIATAGVAEHPHIVGNLVERQQQETHIHPLHNWPQPCHGGAHRHAGEAVLSDRGIEHPQIAVFGMQILGHLVGAAVLTDVLPHHADMGVACHFLIDGITQGVEEKGFGHRASARCAANLSQPPAAKVLSNSTESNMPGSSRATSRPRSWGVMARIRIKANPRQGFRGVPAAASGETQAKGPGRQRQS